MNSIIENLRSYVETRFLANLPLAQGNDESLLKAGVVDAFGVLDLVTYIENQYYIRIENHEFDPEQFDTIHKLAAAVESRLFVSAVET